MMSIIEKIKRLPRLIRLLQSYLMKDENALLALIEDEAKDALKHYEKMGICNTEEIEDLLFHIKSYSEIPQVVRDLDFPDIKEVKFIFEKGYLKAVELGKERPSAAEIERYILYVEEVEKQRAVERDFIFDKVKNLPLGMVLAC